MSDYTPTTEEVRANYLPPRTEIVDADEQFDRWLAKHDREVKAEAWDEGFAEGLGDGCSCDSCLKWVSNPYRKETE